MSNTCLVIPGFSNPLFHLVPECSSCGRRRETETQRGRERREGGQARENGMAQFKLQNVEDFYEIGEVLGR